MVFFRSTNIDFLGWKWRFLGFSLIFSTAGILSMLFWHGLPLGVDFRGGTEVQVQFKQRPDIGAIRQAMDSAGFKDAKIQNYGGSADGVSPGAAASALRADATNKRAQSNLTRRMEWLPAKSLATRPGRA